MKFSKDEGQHYAYDKNDHEVSGFSHITQLTKLNPDLLEEKYANSLIALPVCFSLGSANVTVASLVLCLYGRVSQKSEIQGSF